MINISPAAKTDIVLAMEMY